MDSTINQLTFLYENVCQALDNGKEVRVVCYDISKAFDRVWHAGLLCKLKAVGTYSSLLSWFSSYLSNRRQRVTLPGVYSNLKCFSRLFIRPPALSSIYKRHS